jgi:hypothetical protein
MRIAGQKAKACWQAGWALKLFYRRSDGVSPTARSKCTRKRSVAEDENA